MKIELYAQYKDNPKGLENYFLGMNYKFLGWQATSDNTQELKLCFELGHMGHQGQDKKTVYDIQHTRTGSNVTYWCSECKHYWKIDMSD